MMDNSSFDERLVRMTPDELILAIGEMDELTRHPAWAAILAVLQEDREVADITLHTSHADDVVSIAMSQTTCAAIDRMREIPGVMARRYREALEEF